MDITRYKDFHKGQNIVVAGCGPSVQRLVDAFGPPLCVSITVNDAGQWFKPTYALCVDPMSRLDGRWEATVKTDCHAFFMYGKRPDECRLLAENNHMVIPYWVNHPRRTMEPSDDGKLSHFLDTPWVATSLAIYMGAARIGFIGVDHNDDLHSLASQRPRIRQGYFDLRDHWKARRGIEFYRLAEESSLPFDHMDYSEFARPE